MKSKLLGERKLCLQCAEGLRGAYAVEMQPPYESYMGSCACCKREEFPVQRYMVKERERGGNEKRR